MNLRFTKMHGAGNDFVVLDRMQGAPLPDAALAQRLADRHFGVGCDQIMVVERVEAGYGYRIYNADGSVAGQCGNGARCVAMYLKVRYGLDSGALLQSPAGPIAVHFPDADTVELSLGAPRFAPAEVPLKADAAALRYALGVGGRQIEFAALSMGNPHAVIEVADVASAPVATLGPRLERHPRFPDRTNVGFVERVDASHLRLRVWERGVGETLACGSGACAAMVAMRRWGRVDAEVAIDLPGGRLGVRWAGAEAPVYLSGPAVFVFDGEFYT